MEQLQQAKKEKANEYFYYLGKSSSSKPKQHHLLIYHSLDVAAVATALLQKNTGFTNDLAKLLELESKELIKLFGFFVAIHDLGKFSSAFQLLFENSLFTFNQNGGIKPYDGSEFRHDRLGYYFWQKNEETVTLDLVGEENLTDNELDEAIETLEILLLTVLGHHGKPIKTSTFGLKSFIELHNEQAAADFLQAMLDIFKPHLPLNLLLDENWQAKLKQISWHLAGLAVLADWLGSNTDFFPYESTPLPLDEFWLKAQANACNALQATDICSCDETANF